MSSVLGYAQSVWAMPNCHQPKECINFSMSPSGKLILVNMSRSSLVRFDASILGATRYLPSTTSTCSSHIALIYTRFGSIIRKTPEEFEPPLGLVEREGLYRGSLPPWTQNLAKKALNSSITLQTL